MSLSLDPGVTLPCRRTKDSRPLPLPANTVFFFTQNHLNGLGLSMIFFSCCYVHPLSFPGIASDTKQIHSCNPEPFCQLMKRTLTITKQCSRIHQTSEEFSPVCTDQAGLKFSAGVGKFSKASQVKIPNYTE